MIPGLPLGFRIELDKDLQRYADGHLLLGAHPARLWRLNTAAARAVDRLRAQGVRSDSEATLARRLVDAGLAHPRPLDAAAEPSVTVVVPVRDRPRELAACLAGVASTYPTVVVDDGSLDVAATEAVCREHGARLIRRPASGGPAAARNAALGHVSSDVVAFLDSDSVAESQAIARLLPHFADPLVAAVAPRVRPLDGRSRRSVLERYTAVASSLDLGPDRSAVEAHARVSYVPSAALLVRRAALDEGFDATLRYGEDVDLVWRLVERGWRVRYEPAVTVRHREPTRFPAFLARRYRYGTSAGPLAVRHPGRLAPLVLTPASGTAVTGALLGRPAIVLFAWAAGCALLARRTAGTGLPLRVVPVLVARDLLATFLATGTAASQLAWPLVLAGLIRRGRARRTVAVLLLAPPMAGWLRRRPDLDPARWASIAIADAVAYGTGVLVGALRSRSAGPIVPAPRVGGGLGQAASRERARGPLTRASAVATLRSTLWHPLPPHGKQTRERPPRDVRYPVEVRCRQ